MATAADDHSCDPFCTSLTRSGQRPRRSECVACKDFAFPGVPGLGIKELGALTQVLEIGASGFPADSSRLHARGALPGQAMAAATTIMRVRNSRNDDGDTNSVPSRGYSLRGSWWRALVKR